MRSAGDPSVGVGVKVLPGSTVLPRETRRPAIFVVTGPVSALQRWATQLDQHGPRIDSNDEEKHRAR
jgi:hypothetical protein